MSVPKSMRILALVVAASAPLGLLGCGGSDGGSSSGDTQVAFVSGGTAGVGGYEQSHLESFKAMCSKYDFDCSVIDEVDYAGAPRTLTRLATSGTDLVVANSSGFADSLEEVAPDFPETWFVMTSNIEEPKGFDNLAGFVNDYTELGYLGGVAGAHISQGDIFGFANGEPLEVIDQLMGGFIDGARTVDPNSKLLVRDTNSFTDATLAREASKAEIAQGADLLSSTAGSATPGSIQAAQQAKVDFIGYFADEYERAPCCVRTSMVVNTKQQYDKLGELYASEKLQPKLYRSTVENGGITLAPLRGVPTATAEKIQAVQKKIADGDIQVTSEPYESP